MKLDFSKITNVTVKFLEKNSSKILLGLGISGMILSTVSAVKETPRAMSQIEGYKRKVKRDKGVDVELSKTEVIKLCWKFYVPSGTLAIMSIGCLVGSSVLSDKKQAALAAAYSLSESALRDYKNKVISQIGPEEEKKIRESIIKDKVSKINDIDESEIIYTGQGDVICYDHWSDRLFRSDKESIRKAENDINRDLLSDGFVSLNDFYYYLNLRPTKAGDILGWDTRAENISIEYTSILSPKGIPCLAISFVNFPYQGYDRFTN